MRRKYTIDPVSPGIKFEFDRESTKDFGGMIVNRKTYGKYGKKSGQPAGNPNNRGSRAGGGGRKGGDVSIPSFPKATNRPARPTRSRRMIP